jgi:hypothetical protein
MYRHETLTMEINKIEQKGDIVTDYSSASSSSSSDALSLSLSSERGGGEEASQLESLNTMNRMLQLLASIGEFLDLAILEVVLRDIESLFTNYTAQVERTRIHILSFSFSLFRFAANSSQFIFKHHHFILLNLFVGLFVHTHTLSNSLVCVKIKYEKNDNEQIVKDMSLVKSSESSSSHYHLPLSKAPTLQDVKDASGSLIHHATADISSLKLPHDIGASLSDFASEFFAPSSTSTSSHHYHDDSNTASSTSDDESQYPGEF